jgi:5-methylcytosine-specific restriction protein B
MIQFHQSYSYEDFIQGYRPMDDGTFKLENGVFYRFCKKAQSDPDKKYIFIIDEINRGNLSKIFGELMLLIESDKRGKNYGVSLTYFHSNDSKFYIPDNVYIIGTMNTADRSLAMVDYALRRRFVFINVMPNFNQKFENELINNGVDEGIVERIVNRVESLNQQIKEDANLGKGFQIGHSYFCNFYNSSGDEDWYKFIVQHEIGPLLEEYWFDNEDKAQTQIQRLLD